MWILFSSEGNCSMSLSLLAITYIQRVACVYIKRGSLWWWAYHITGMCKIFDGRFCV